MKASHVYRPDVDGLRAVAVLAVVAFHVLPKRVRGGFVGVDVFFVISGFLITGIIVERLQQGHFSIADFYARRVRRIFPALSLVLLACLIAGWFILLPTEYAALGRTTAGGAGFVSNILLWKVVDYFGADALTTPLLHLWSLGIEEQYYAVWPLLLAALWRTRYRLMPILGGFAASFAYSVYASRHHPGAAFYNPASRMWELLLGSTLAYITAVHGDPLRDAAPHVRDACAWLGIALILSGIATLTGESKFPGVAALLPTCGTALVVAAGPRALLNRTLLSHPWVVYVGLISYPLYLWHWPLLAFMREEFPDAPLAAKSALIPAMFVLAALTHRFVELPVRRNATRRSVAVLSLAQACLLVVGLGVLRGGGIPVRGEGARRGIFAAETDTVTDAPFAAAVPGRDPGSCFLTPRRKPSSLPARCTTATPGDSAALLLWGDSFAAHLAVGVDAARAPGTTLVQITGAGCAPIFGYVNPYMPNCAETNRFAEDWIRRHRPGTIVVAARWRLYPLDAAVDSTLARLRRYGVRRVIVVGSSAEFREPVPRFLMRALGAGAVPRRLPLYRLDTLRAVDGTLAAKAARSGAEFVSPLAAECDSTGCLVALDSAGFGVTVRDDGHLTRVGSRFVGDRVLRPVLRGQRGGR